MQHQLFWTLKLQRLYFCLVLLARFSGSPKNHRERSELSQPQIWDQYGVIERELQRIPLVKKEFYFGYYLGSLLSNTQVLRQQNGSKLQ